MDTSRLLAALRESGFLVAVLLLTLLLSGTLLYQAHAAIEQQGLQAGRQLQDYAAVGSRELIRNADDLLDRRWSTVLSAALPAGHPSAGSPGGAHAAISAMRREVGACGCERGVAGYFAFADSARPVVMEVVDSARTSAEMRDSLASLGTADGSRDGAIPRGDTLRARPFRLDGRTVVAVYRLAGGMGDGRRAAMGVVLDPAAMAPAVLGDAMRGRPLLPPLLLGDAEGADALAVVATGEAGDTLFRSPTAEAGLPRRWLRAYDERMTVRDTLPRTPEVRERPGGMLAGLTLAVAVRPEMSGVLAVGSQAGSRLPLLLGAFTLNLVLFAIAVMQLRRQHELARLRSDFVSGVSHELRTPLAQIRLFAELLENGRLSDAQRERSIRVIQKDARRLTYLVENILRFARSERGGERIVPAWTPVAPLVREVVHGFAFIAPDTVLRLALDEGVEAHFDPEAFRQVLLNLLENAAKYGPRGQAVTVGAGLVDGRLRVWVDDAGPGIPLEERSRVWRPYHRLKRDAESAAGGSGIGLAIVRRLAELHGGRAWVGGSPAGGARFVVELPLARRVPAPDSTDATAASTDTPAPDPEHASP